MWRVPVNVLQASLLLLLEKRLMLQAMSSIGESLKWTRGVARKQAGRRIQAGKRSADIRPVKAT